VEILPKHSDLVYDVGMNNGDDTAFYLGKGFRVVAFEADPDLTALCRERFTAAIRCRQLCIVEGAIVESEAVVTGRRVVFYRNRKNLDWGTAVAQWADRNRMIGGASEPVTVAAVDFSEAVRVHGIPHFIKIDIEGSDLVCLRALELFQPRPDFISIESDKRSLPGVAHELDLLEALGFQRFKLVQQEKVPKQRAPVPAREGRDYPHDFRLGTSGLFGRDLPGRWLTRRQAQRAYRPIMLWYRLFGDFSLVRQTPLLYKVIRRPRHWLRDRLSISLPGWYDTHAWHRDAAQGGPLTR
jgi:FkbM family methyltransferase